MLVAHVIQSSYFIFLLPVHQIVSMIWFSMCFSKSMDTNCVLIVSNTSSPRLNLQYYKKEIKARFAENSPRNFVEAPANFRWIKRNLAVILAKFRIHRSEFRFAEISPWNTEILVINKILVIDEILVIDKVFFLKLSTKMMIFNSTITILIRNNRTAAAVAFSFRQTKLLKPFVQLVRGNFFKRICEFFFCLKSFCKKTLLNLVLSLFMKKSTK